MKKKAVRKLIKKLISKNDACQVCKDMGQNLPECQCMKDKECAKHMLELFLADKGE